MNKIERERNLEKIWDLPKSIRCGETPPFPFKNKLKGD